MSTSLKTVKHNAALTKTIFGYNDRRGAIDFKTRALGSTINNFLRKFEFTMRTLTPDDQKTRYRHVGSPEVERDFFNYLCMANMMTFSEAYPDIQKNTPDIFKRHEEDTERAAKALPTLEKLAFPCDGHGVAQLIAAINDTLHGLETQEDPVAELLEGLSNDLAPHAIQMHPDMPFRFPGTEETVQALLSTATYGDKHMGLQNGFRLAIESLRTTGTHVNSQSVNELYPMDVLVDLTEQYLKNDDIQFRLDGFKSNLRLPSATSKSGLTVKIQGDIPNKGREGVFLAAKLINDLADHVKTTNFSNLKVIGPAGPVEASPVERAAFQSKLDKTRKSFNNMMVSELEGFKKHWGRDLSESPSPF